VKIFKVKDKSGRLIYLTDERWKHIKSEHPEVTNFLEEIKETITQPTKVTAFYDNEKIKYYYKYFKKLKSPEKYFLVIVKYLNGNGFIITAYFVKSIR